MLGERWLPCLSNSIPIFFLLLLGSLCSLPLFFFPESHHWPIASLLFISTQNSNREGGEGWRSTREKQWKTDPKKYEGRGYRKRMSETMMERVRETMTERVREKACGRRWGSGWGKSMGDDPKKIEREIIEGGSLETRKVFPPIIPFAAQPKTT